MTPARPAAVVTLVALSVALSAGAFSEKALACAIFLSARAAPLPTLAHEQVLIIYEGEREHVIREVTFGRADRPLGFVVPTPSRPEVAAVADPPFDALAEGFAFTPRPQARMGAGRGTDGLTVLEVSRVGSFEAFVLEAHDAAALSSWLVTQRLVDDPASAAWVSGYVDLGFLFVAMRYEPRPGQAGDKKPAETIRISFSTPRAYYPYREPEREGSSERLLDLWVVASEPLAPVAFADGRWINPFQPGQTHSRAREALAKALDARLAALLPPGELGVQTFVDQKSARRGYGDVVFVPTRKEAIDPAKKARLSRFVPLLDPSLAKP